MTEEERSIQAVRIMIKQFPKCQYSTVIGDAKINASTLTFISYNDTNASIEFRAAAWKHLQYFYANRKNELERVKFICRVVSSEPIPGPHNLRRVVVSIKVKDK